MRRYRLSDLGSEGPEHVASKLIPGRRIAAGGLSFHAPGGRTHPEGEHRHDHHEVFCIMQGQGTLWVDGRTEPVRAGDVIVIEPGEEHYLYADAEQPTINCWFRADEAGHPRQYPPAGQPAASGARGASAAGQPQSPASPILITGAASPLGRAVAAVLAAAGHSLRAVDRIALPAAAAPALADGFQEGDLLDPAFMGALVRGAAGIVHLAPLVLPAVMRGGGPGEVLDVVARGTHVLYKAALEAGVEWAVQASTLAVMEAYDQGLEVTEQWRPRPQPAPEQLAPYLAELVAREFTRDVQLASPLRITCLRFAPLVDDADPRAREGDPSFDPQVLRLADAAEAVRRALSALSSAPYRGGHRWQVLHIASPSPLARYSSAAARQAIGYGGEPAVAASQGGVR